MSRQTLDLRRSAQIVWRHKLVVATITAIGLAANVAHTTLRPQDFSASTLVVLSPSVNLSTQSVVVDSIPVLSDAMRRTNTELSLDELQNRIDAKRAAVQMIKIAVHGEDADWAVRTVNAVTLSYISYIGSSRNPVGQQPAALLLSAKEATVKPLSTRVFEAAVLGFLAGLLTGVVAALAVWRGDRRLRERDAIADSIGVPVLASVRADSPPDTAGWTKLIERHALTAGDVCQLRTVLCDLLTTAADDPRRGVSTGTSLGVLSLSHDRDALALGPLLAACAAAAGIPTTLLIGRQQDEKATVALRGACGTATSRRRENLMVGVTSDRDATQPPDGLTVVVGVVDGQTPRVATTTRAATTVLGVTADAVQAEQLVRVAASAAGDGRALAGVLVANASGSDHTTGRMPELARPEQNRMPTRLTGVVTENR